MQLSDLLKIQLEKNIEYVLENGYKGAEPHMLSDLYFSHRAKINPVFFNKILRKIEVKIIDYFPSLFEPYLKLQGLPNKQLTPYALGFFLQAYCFYYNVRPDKKIKNEVYNVLDLLEPLLIIKKSGLGVGNAKNQKTTTLGMSRVTDLTVYAPGGAECFYGLMEAYKTFGDNKFKVLALKIANTFENEFTFKYIGLDKGCFDYSDINDGTHILNANILIADVLLTASEFIDIDMKRVEYSFNYVMDYIKKRRYLPYAGDEDRDTSKNIDSYDSYHAGFVLRAIHDMCTLLRFDNTPVVDKAKLYFLDFVYNGQVSKFKGMPNFDIHSFAEYIRMYAVFYEYIDDVDKFHIEQCIINSFTLYESKIDSRRYIFRKKNGKVFDIYMPLWGQSSMMASISFLVSRLNC